MRGISRQVIVWAVGVAVLGGPAKAQTTEQLIDAMVFLAKGEEDGMPVEKSQPIKKTLKDGRYVYEVSGFGEYLSIHAKSSKACVFELGQTFMGKDIQPEVYDLNKAIRFTVERYFNESMGHYGQVVLEGGDVYCFNDTCTRYHSMTIKNTNQKPRQKQLEVLARNDRAIEFLKKACPGKPY
jgi:hypothetical protein